MSAWKGKDSNSISQNGEPTKLSSVIEIKWVSRLSQWQTDKLTNCHMDSAQPLTRIGKSARENYYKRKNKLQRSGNIPGSWSQASPFKWHPRGLMLGDIFGAWLTQHYTLPRHYTVLHNSSHTVQPGTCHDAGAAATWRRWQQSGAIPPAACRRPLNPRDAPSGCGSKKCLGSSLHFPCGTVCATSAACQSIDQLTLIESKLLSLAKVSKQYLIMRAPVQTLFASLSE